MSVKVIIDGYYLKNSRGMAEYANNIISSSNKSVEVLELTFLRFFQNFIPFPIWEQIIIPIYLYFSKGSVILISPYNTFPVVLPRKVTNLIICHDLIFLKSNNVNQNIKSYLGKWYRSIVYKKIKTIKHKRFFACVSKTTLMKLKEFESAADAVCIPNCLNFDLIDFCDNEAGKYGLVITGSGSNKNNNLFIEALNNLIKKSHNFDIVVCGIFNKKDRQRFLKKVYPRNPGQKLKLEKRLTSAQIDKLFQNARYFLSYSNDEGFGIPLLHAVKCGKPIVASDIPVYREILGSEAYAYFSAFDPEDLASKIEQISANVIHVDTSYAEIKKRYSTKQFKILLNQYLGFIENEVEK